MSDDEPQQPLQAEDHQQRNKRRRKEDDSMKQTKVRHAFAQITANGKIGDRISLTWRKPGGSLWIVWQGTIVGHHGNNELAIIWQGLEASDEPVVFPPAEPLRVLTVTHLPPSSPQAVTTVGNHNNHNVNMRLLDQQADQEAGFNVTLTSLCPGLRIPEFIDRQHYWLYPHLWINSPDDLEAAIRLKMTDYTVTLTSTRVKNDLDLDIEILTELLKGRTANPPTTKSQWRPMFLLCGRIVAVIIMAAPVATKGANDTFLATLNKNFAAGRIDIGVLFDKAVSNEKSNLAVTTLPTTTQAVTQNTPHTDVSINDIADAVVARLSNSARRRSRSFTPSPQVMIPNPQVMYPVTPQYTPPQGSWQQSGFRQGNQSRARRRRHY